MFNNGDILVLEHKRSNAKARLLVLDEYPNYRVKIMVIQSPDPKNIGNVTKINYEIWDRDWNIRHLKKRSYMKKEDYYELMKVAVDTNDEQWFNKLYEKSLKVPTREKLL